MEIFYKHTEREKGGRVNGVTEKDTAALMMGDTQQPPLSSPSTDDMAQTPISVMKRGEERKKNRKSLRGERTGTPLRWPPTKSSCSWRVYPHHYILARSHAARHSRIMSCFKKKKKKKELFLFSSSFILLLHVCGHVEFGL